MDFKQYKGKNILAWLSYNANYEGSINRVCYVYPRVLMKGTDYDLVDSADFPTKGAIAVRIQGGYSAEDVSSDCGSLVNIRINDDPYTNKDGNNMYSLKYNPQYGRESSQIWIETFSGKGFYQIIDVTSSIDQLQSDRSIPEPNCTVYTTLILLKCEGELYGPFEYDTKEGTMSLLGVKDYQYNIGEYNAITYNDDLLVIKDPTKDQDDEEELILIPKSSIPAPEECDARYDWISEKKLLDSFLDYLCKENSYTREQVRQLKDTVQQLIERGDNVQFTEERIAKIQSLLQDVDQKERCVKSIVQYALANDNIKQSLVKEIVSNHFDQIQNKVVAISSVQKRVDEPKMQEAALEKNVASLKVSSEITNKAESEEYNKKISELTAELERIQDENKALRERVDLHEEIDKLRAERDQLKSERDKAKLSYDQQLIDNNDLQKQFDSALRTFNDKATQTARILDSKLLDKILRGIGDEPTVEVPASFDRTLLNTEPLDCGDIIGRVTDFVRNKAHRDVSSNDIANYLICITQGFITTFAGEPGTGKTSLCNILAKALGLVANAPQRRFIDISVERGWSSHKDFIGYYNPLSKKMERSNGEVFNAFELMDKECDCDIAEIAPFVILLDEANLSPIEHYWAAFLRNCDFGSVSNRTIPLGGSKSFKLPDHLRFLATVNFDHTTEELSPRFLDRSWVIMLEPTRIDDEVDEDIVNCEDMISFAAMKAAFCIGKNDVIDEAIQNKWNAVQKIFRDHSLQIMPRNQKMVKNYCAVGCRCMERDTPATKYAPLDYAFSQKILPTINGNGENYRLLIEDLLKECTIQNMPISAKHLERMKRIAESNMGFYQFFSH